MLLNTCIFPLPSLLEEYFLVSENFWADTDGYGRYEVGGQKIFIEITNISFLRSVLESHVESRFLVESLKYDNGPHIWDHGETEF